jgi:hypothetical protein
MRSFRLARRAAAAAALAGAAGCMTLDVANSDVPELEDVFTNGANLEQNVGLAFRNFWGVTQGARTNATYPVVQLGALAEIITGTAGATWEVIQEPRVRYDNLDAGQWLARKPWYDLYEVIATQTDALKALDAGIRVGVVNATTPNGADTPRARTFARFLLGASQVYLGIMYDKAFISDESYDPDTYAFEFSPYKDVAAAGIAQLEKAIAEARSAPTNFTLPTEWVNQQSINRDELVRIMNGYILRAVVYTARTPAERAAVDWNRVLTLTSAPNVITRDFGALADQTKSGTTSAFLQYTQLMTDARIDNHLIGPSDTSGTYQAWVATPFEQKNQIQVRTPDRRVHGAGGPATRGKYFDQPATQTMSTTRGTAPHSRYRGVRYGTNYYQTGVIPTMTLVEMDLLRAEALIRLGRAAEAVPLINKTRVANGELPPVTAAGTGSRPACVPRKENGDCGDLLDAMLYEKRIELHAVEAILHWADWRAFGKLPKGSLMQLPVTGRELQTLGLPVYSFGGDLPGSAP